MDNRRPPTVSRRRAIRYLAWCFGLALTACQPGGSAPAPSPAATPRDEKSPAAAAPSSTPEPARLPSEATPTATVAGTLPIFDTHMHYSQNAWEQFPAPTIIATLVRANVPRALVSSSPDEGTRRLYALDPGRIVPFLRPYHGDVDSSNWYASEKSMPYLLERIQTPIYKGIGEVHLHFSNANAPVARAAARLAVERGLFLHAHSDSQAIRLLFAYEPQIKILWAHTGLGEPPETALELMGAYPNLWADISIREYEIAPDGKLAPAWRELFLRHSDRMTIGSDTWVPSRWEVYEQVIAGDRVWLAQLPRDVAEKIAYRNAVRLFGAGPHKYLES